MRAALLRFGVPLAASWGTLFALVTIFDLALRHAGNFIAPEWIATVRLAANCLELCAAGFVAGRMNRAHPIAQVLILAVTLLPVDIGDALALNVPWLIRLTRDLLSDSRFLDSWLATLETNAILLASLIGGGFLSRPAAKPVSVLNG